MSTFTYRLKWPGLHCIWYWPVLTFQNQWWIQRFYLNRIQFRETSIAPRKKIKLRQWLIYCVRLFKDIWRFLYVVTIRKIVSNIDRSEKVSGCCFVRIVCVVDRKHVWEVRLPKISSQRSLSCIGIRFKMKLFNSCGYLKCYSVCLLDKGVSNFLMVILSLPLRTNEFSLAIFP